jgi:hypothetical protein
VKHAFIKLERNGAVSIRWWVDGVDGVATRSVIHVLPGQTAFEVPFERWRERAGFFVDLDEIAHEVSVRPRAN